MEIQLIIIVQQDTVIPQEVNVEITVCIYIKTAIETGLKLFQAAAQDILAGARFLIRYWRIQFCQRVTDGLEDGCTLFPVRNESFIALGNRPLRSSLHPLAEHGGYFG